MADNDQEKTEYQSQKKLEQSRDRGELPRSQELATFLVFAVFIIYFGIVRLAWFDGLGAIMGDLLTFDRHLDLTRETLGEFVLIPIVKAMAVLAPLLVMIMILSPAVTMIQTGFNFAKEKLTPDWSRLDPVSGLRRIFSLHQWIEGLKACVKIGLFAWLSWGAIRKALPALGMIGADDVREQLATMLDLSMAIGVRIAVLMAALAAADYGYQWWEFQKKLRMTHQEMKDELKEREGNPLIKQRQRSLAMQRARRRMMAEVPKASVVVTNPTHFAVALTYDREKAPAPYVAAKGAQYMALKIREVAREHGVPIIENKPLARALYKQVKVGQIIPSQFYKAVAEVLAFVFLLKQRKAGHERTKKT